MTDKTIDEMLADIQAKRIARGDKPFPELCEDDTRTVDEILEEIRQRRAQRNAPVRH